MMTTGQSLEDGAAGIALLHLETGNWSAAMVALRGATVDGVTMGEGASLFYGAPALTFVLAAVERPAFDRARAIVADGTATVTRRRLDAAHRRIDRHRQPHYAEYDLIGGLTGLGVVLRRLGDHDLLRDVLTYLVRPATSMSPKPTHSAVTTPWRPRTGCSTTTAATSSPTSANSLPTGENAH